MKTTNSLKKLIDISNLILIPDYVLLGYQNMFDRLLKTLESDYSGAIKELENIMATELKFFSEKFDEKLKKSKKTNYKNHLESIKILNNAVHDDSPTNLALTQAAFYTAIGNTTLAKEQHLKNYHHDSDLIFNAMMQRFNQELFLQNSAKKCGYNGGSKFAKKSEEAVFLALDLWRKDYQSLTNKQASRLLFDVINKKIDELNKNISSSRNTDYTVMSNLVSPDTIALWIAAYKRLIDEKPLVKKTRHCIQQYFDMHHKTNTYHF